MKKSSMHPRTTAQSRADRAALSHQVGYDQQRPASFAKGPRTENYMSRRQRTGGSDCRCAGGYFRAAGFQPNNSPVTANNPAATETAGAKHTATAAPTNQRVGNGPTPKRG